jgi:hypothetical protein
VNAVHREMHRASHQAQTPNVAVKIYRHVVVHQFAQVRHVKHVMAQIHAEQDLHQWIAINLVCVHESLNQIFQKMLQVKS